MRADSNVCLANFAASQVATAATNVTLIELVHQSLNADCCPHDDVALEARLVSLRSGKSRSHPCRLHGSTSACPATSCADQAATTAVRDAFLIGRRAVEQLSQDVLRS